MAERGTKSVGREKKCRPTRRRAHEVTIPPPKKLPAAQQRRARLLTKTRVQQGWGRRPSPPHSSVPALLHIRQTQRGLEARQGRALCECMRVLHRAGSLYAIFSFASSARSVSLFFPLCWLVYLEVRAFLRVPSCMRERFRRVCACLRERERERGRR